MEKLLGLMGKDSRVQAIMDLVSEYGCAQRNWGDLSGQHVRVGAPLSPDAMAQRRYADLAYDEIDRLVTGLVAVGPAPVAYPAEAGEEQ